MVSGIELFDAAPELIEKFNGRLRKEDIEECAKLGVDAYKSLRLSWSVSSACFCGFVDGEPAAVFGTVKTAVLSDDAVVWMLGTDVLYSMKAKKKLLKTAKRFLSVMLERYTRLYNIVDADNSRALLFLKACGFSFGKACSAGISGELFYPFEIRRQENV